MHQKKKKKKKKLAFYFTQMEFSMTEISRMGSEAEKVAGLWAGQGAMYRLLMPHFLSPGCVSGSRGAERPDCRCVSPAIWGNVGFTCNPSFRSFSPAANTSPDSTGMCHSLERLLPAQATACAGGKLTLTISRIPQGCCKHPAVSHRDQSGENPS